MASKASAWDAISQCTRPTVSTLFPSSDYVLGLSKLYLHHTLKKGL